MDGKSPKLSGESTGTIIDGKKPCKDCGNDKFAVEKMTFRIEGATMTAILSRRCIKCKKMV